MEKFNTLRHGTLRLPPGFRFQPTDQELVFQYLQCKVFSWPLPASIIPEFNVCKHDPWDLPGDMEEEERYFFSYKEAKYPNGNRINRTTVSGYWKATGVDKRIVSSSRKFDVVGMKKTLVFYSGKPLKGCRTDWVMHEYRLVHDSFNQLEKWVLCRVFPKRRNAAAFQTCKDNKVKVDVVMKQPVFFDFLAKNEIPVPCTSSSNSSNITDVSSSCDENDYEENSSSQD